ncbi:hypothetical protein CWE04_11290 [Thomasclavelia cocleata]|uniref:Uncharacterized protein n=1 Tax=Thomasclavelia cocleata TaxID=69824 RepID=A0A1I0BHD9_9FIRM|nr:hypothetical protein [Thomasclavelia cocleata]MCR1959888.1 hypothetical protein [Thomasclavelia cocleata]NDO41766.1 hypothetical protein [Thomasclavelia cocleata]PJN79793.1 hypothetical protein CWE04_11290 [Thomasclavelia cocleata]SET05621.1 hypothetical protein SAMN04489758_101105 [Thomasclavelia cocleata]
MNEKKQLRMEVKLVLLLNELCPDCTLHRGVEEKYVIASVLFKGKFGLSSIVDCNHIHQVIKESGKNCLSPKEVFKKFVGKGWLEDAN